ncbi:MAG: hypothetical protein FRX48_02004 [Lasallia pustulata]|uniref:Uncharacterized protein n=1 Tax=Lasallia pustulata TaxID=136370 RepID=A0A5M8PVE1_9LECA|nr:MAG: hypothetical protein FRX48_02004 [Lasallia pustulata]
MATIVATIICSETTTTHSCGHHSIQTVHRCDRDNCVYMAHPRESSTELCDVCQCLNRLNQGGFNRFNPGAYDVLRQQVLAHRMRRNPQAPQRRRRRLAQRPQVPPRNTLPQIPVRAPPIRDWRGVLRAATGRRASVVVEVATLLAKVWDWWV